MTEGVPEHVCAAVPHHYFDFWVMWCPHRQGFVVTESSHTETGTAADPTNYRSVRTELGPFDGKAEVKAMIERWIEQLPEPGAR